jgi:Zn-dependent protease with chaperone function
MSGSRPSTPSRFAEPAAPGIPPTPRGVSQLLAAYGVALAVWTAGAALVVGWLWHQVRPSILGEWPWAVTLVAGTLAAALVVGATAWRARHLLRGDGSGLAGWSGGEGLAVLPKLGQPPAVLDELETRLLSTASEVARTAGVPRGKLFVLRGEPALNAFAAGWTPSTTAIVVTRGALEVLGPEELRALLSQLYAHVKRGDARLQMAAASLVWGFAWLQVTGEHWRRPDAEGTPAATGRRLAGAVLAFLGQPMMAFAGALQQQAAGDRELQADGAAARDAPSLRIPLAAVLQKVWYQQGRGTDRLQGARLAALASMLLWAPASTGRRHEPLPARLRRLTGQDLEPLPCELLTSLAVDPPIAQEQPVASRPGPLLPVDAPMAGDLAGRLSALAAQVSAPAPAGTELSPDDLARALGVAGAAVNSPVATPATTPYTAPGFAGSGFDASLGTTPSPAASPGAAARPSAPARPAPVPARGLAASPDRPAPADRLDDGAPAPASAIAAAWAARTGGEASRRAPEPADRGAYASGSRGGIAAGWALRAPEVFASAGGAAGAPITASTGAAAAPADARAGRFVALAPVPPPGSPEALEFERLAGLALSGIAPPATAPAAREAMTTRPAQAASGSSEGGRGAGARAAPGDPIADTAAAGAATRRRHRWRRSRPYADSLLSPGPKVVGRDADTAVTGPPAIAPSASPTPAASADRPAASPDRAAGAPVPSGDAHDATAVDIPLDAAIERPALHLPSLDMPALDRGLRWGGSAPTVVDLDLGMKPPASALNAIPLPEVTELDAALPTAERPSAPTGAPLTPPTPPTPLAPLPPTGALAAPVAPVEGPSAAVAPPGTGLDLEPARRAGPPAAARRRSGAPPSDAPPAEPRAAAPDPAAAERPDPASAESTPESATDDATPATSPPDAERSGARMSATPAGLAPPVGSAISPSAAPLVLREVAAWLDATRAQPSRGRRADETPSAWPPMLDDEPSRRDPERLDDEGGRPAAPARPETFAPTQIQFPPIAVPADAAGSAAADTAPPSRAPARGAPPATARAAAPDPTLQDARARLSRLQGPGELRAAILAYMVSPGSDREVRAWRSETESFARAAQVFADLNLLPPAARLPWFSELVRRASLGSIEDRRSLVEAARRVMTAAGVVKPLERLRWLALRHGLGHSQKRAVVTPVAPSPTGELAFFAPNRRPIATYSAFLARLVPLYTSDVGIDPLGARWYDAVMQRFFGAQDVPAAQVPDSDALVHALWTLQSMPWMSRPPLIRAWVGEAVVHSAPNGLPRDAADALYLTCMMLDSPMPPDLARLFIEING